MLKPGEVVADRFEIEGWAGAGGVGTVFCARDRLNGRKVALKLVPGANRRVADRIQREARALALVDHPRIVHYVGHGPLEEGDLYLAMEWLEGEDLAKRLKRGSLPVHETLALARGLADALAAAHARRILHRDLKPSNILLVDGRPENAHLIDFGLVRWSGAREVLTADGEVVGTPLYMSPEQASARDEIDARTDVFSLGRVLYECVTGTRAVASGRPIGMLARIVLEDAPRVADAAPDAPVGLAALIDRMQARDPAERPADGAELAAELAALAEGDGGGRRAPRRAITSSEQVLLSIVLASGVSADDPRGPLTQLDVASADTPPATAFHAGAALAARELTEHLRAAARRHGARLEVLADRSVVAIVTGGAAATDLAERAVELALEVQALVPGAAIAVAVGRGRVTTEMPVGDVVDRAARLLEGEASAVDAPADLRVDATTAALVGARYELVPVGDCFALTGRAGDASARRVLGRPTPFVGRERELAALASLFAECIDEPAARAVLLVGEAGIGKSRLRAELGARLRWDAGQAQVWAGRADPVGAGSPFRLLGDALRGAIGLSRDAEPALQRARLDAEVARLLPAGERSRVSDFLGELLGLPAPAEESVLLRATRQDRRILGDQLRRAWEDFLAASCATGPVVLVLENLHWGDLPSVQFIDSALRQLHDRPLFVLALARPEVRDWVPDLWRDRDVHEVRLAPLTRRATEQLVKSVLGAEAASSETIARLTQQAAGNAFYLEELMRAEAEGRRGVPTTVLAMLHARLEALDAEARRILRAASILGQRFWRGGILVLLADCDPLEVDRHLDALVQSEMVVDAGTLSRFPGQPELRFRHALIQEAAYTTLTEEDLELGHRLAAGWLVSMGEHDALSLAEHFELGGSPAEAAEQYRRAAGQALAGHDLRGAIERADRALACGLDDAGVAEMCVLKGEAHMHRGEMTELLACGQHALERAATGSDVWFHAIGMVTKARDHARDVESVVGLARRAHEVLEHAPPSIAQVIYLGRSQLGLLDAGEAALAEAHMRYIERVVHGLGDAGPLPLARLSAARSFVAIYGGDHAAGLALSFEATHLFEAAGDLRTAMTVYGNIGQMLMELGDFAGSERLLRRQLELAERIGVEVTAAQCKVYLAMALSVLGRTDEALRVIEEARAFFAVRGDKRGLEDAHVYAARILLDADQLAEAERAAEQAMGLAAADTARGVYARAIVAAVRLARGRVAEALANAEEAARVMIAVGNPAEGEALVRLTHAEVLAAAGQTDRAREVLRAARDRLLERAELIADAERRRGFLDLVPEHARTMELAAAWGIGDMLGS